VTREGPDLTMDESGLNLLNDEDSNDVPDSSMLEGGRVRGRGGEGEEEAEEEEVTVAPPLLPLDQAILYSIEKCGG